MEFYTGWKQHLSACFLKMSAALLLWAEIKTCWSLEVSVYMFPCCFVANKLRHIVLTLKDPFPNRLHTHAVYKFPCTSCKAYYVGEASQYFFVWYPWALTFRQALSHVQTFTDLALLHVYLLNNINFFQILTVQFDVEI